MKSVVMMLVLVGTLSGCEGTKYEYIYSGYVCTGAIEEYCGMHLFNCTHFKLEDQQPSEILCAKGVRKVEVK